eukprot:Skav229817  [mRNA]  locus=scaffold567:409765:412300:- [translate_table: standard]
MLPIWLAACAVANGQFSDEAWLANLADPVCIESLRKAPAQGNPLGDVSSEVLESHAKQCEGGVFQSQNRMYWIVTLRLAAYVDRAAGSFRAALLKLLRVRSKIGRFGMCLPLSCLAEGTSEWQEEVPLQTVALTHWFTFHVILNSSPTSYPLLEASDIKSISRCCNLTITTPTCRSVTKASFPILRFFESESLPPEMMQGLRVASLGAFVVPGTFHDASDEKDGITMLLHQGAEVFGFDSPEGCEPTNAEAASAEFVKCGGQFRCIERLIGDGKEHQFFFHYGAPWVSSLFPPNKFLWSHMITMDASGHRKRNVSTYRLDDLGLEPIHFLKMDIQGAEMMALSGAEKVLENVLVVQAEEHIYDDQPLFWELDRYLRQRGFTFHRLIDLRGLDMRPFYNDQLKLLLTQQLMGDAIYVRGMYGDVVEKPRRHRSTSSQRFKALTPSEAVLAAWILHEVFQSYDVALHLLRLYVPGSISKSYFLYLADSVNLTDHYAFKWAIDELAFGKNGAAP